MRIIEAHWEERNLGVKTAEVVLDEEDTEKGLARLAEVEAGHGYVVAKVGQGGTHLFPGLQLRGYRYVEVMLRLRRRLDAVEPPKAFLRLDGEVAHRRVDDAGLGAVLDAVSAGIFETDRIATDGAFPREASAARYRNWLCDLHAEGAGVYELQYNGQGLGFFSLKAMDAETAYVPLVGLYPDFRVPALGFAPYYRPLREAKAQGFHWTVGGVSSNNLAALRMSIACGYQVTGTETVFVLHR